MSIQFTLYSHFNKLCLLRSFISPRTYSDLMSSKAGFRIFALHGAVITRSGIEFRSFQPR